MPSATTQQAIVELSTLTGAIIIALGSHAIGMMGTDQALIDQLSQAGEASGERVWQFPLWDEYHQMVKSEIADLKNLAGRAGGFDHRRRVPGGFRGRLSLCPSRYRRNGLG